VPCGEIDTSSIKCHAAKLIQVVLNESTAHSFGDKNMFLIIDIKNAK
jgi:hypothetical protein